MVLYWLKDALTPTSIEDERVNTRNKIILVIIESAATNVYGQVRSPLQWQLKLSKEKCVMAQF